jgi:hypothetical protein
MVIFPTLWEPPEMVKKEAFNCFRQQIHQPPLQQSPPFRKGCWNLHLKRKKDKSEQIEGKSSADELVTYLHSRDDVSYMCLCTTW